MDWTKTGIIWDVDGTILDSMPYWEHVSENYLADLQISLDQRLDGSTKPFSEIMFNMTLPECAQYVKDAFALTQPTEEILEGLLGKIMDDYEYRIPFKEGVEEVLKRLHEAGCPMLIATSSASKLVSAALKRLNISDYFTEIISCSENGLTKREAKVFEVCLEKLGTTAECTFIFEDGLYAIQTANAQGIHTIGIYDAASEKEQKQLKQEAAYYVSAALDAEEIMAWIQNTVEAKKKPQRKISVRNLVEFILREGDLDTSTARGMDPDAMQAGARLHRKLQGRGGSSYEAEVPLQVTLDIECAMLTVEGRADGVIEGILPVRGMPIEMQQMMQQMKEEKTRLVTIDEIKCMYRNIYDYSEPEALHLAQAKCYAYMIARSQGLSHVMVQITYANLENEATRHFWEYYSFLELEKWFFGVIFKYSQFLEFELKHLEQVRTTAKTTNFPFSYRPGQKDLAAMVYLSVKRKENLLCQAPTGVGKTISTIFPAVKAMGEGFVEKIFYLTAKTITRTVAEETFTVLRKQGLCISSVTISARDKLCILEERNCNPLICERAKGHYDRVNECLLEMLENETIMTRECIEEYADAYKVCPYELTLDLALWVDAVICDYNYLFDPKVHLKRFFSEQAKKSDYVFLVDEAHNLVDRGRDMYSAQITKMDIEKAQEYLKPLKKEQKAVNAAIEKCIDDMKLYETAIFYDSSAVLFQNENYLICQNCDNFYVSLLRFLTEMDKMLEERTDFEGYDEVMDLYFNVHHFLNMYDKIDKNYEIYAQYTESQGVKIKLFCINPSKVLSDVLEKGRSTIFFSATLLPINYYKELLTGNQDSQAIYIPSPFEQEKRFLAIASGVTSKYNCRGPEQYQKMISYLQKSVVKPGNYMVFFSSYKMMQDVYDMALEMGLDQDKRVICQTNHMTEQEREDFLEEFQSADEQCPLLAFCILGGIFSEGIDLKEDALIGAFIIGNGLPQVCVERKLISDYFDQQNMDGFSYAYIYPGMNKVLQAAGRVIRTEQDEGIILLMDDRFHYSQYKRLFPREWEDVKGVTLDNVHEQIQHFWNKK